MKDEHFIALLFAAVFGFAVLVLLTGGCGSQLPPARRAQAVSCLDLANAALTEAQSCEQARAALARAIGDAPQCAAIFGLHVNMESDAGVVRCDD